MRSQLSIPPHSDSSVRARLPLNVAHRGASAQAPENTLSAIRRAAEVGADMVEVDVQRTRDGELVLMHDATLVRTTDVRRRFPDRSPWRVGDFTVDELQQLDAGGWRSPYSVGERVPTLPEALDLTWNLGLGMLLELKLPELHPGVVGDLTACLSDSWGHLYSAVAAGRLVVQSFDVASMKELKTRLPEVPVGLLGRPSTANLPALSTWAAQVNPGRFHLDRGYVEAVQSHGMACLVWTIDRGPGMRRALRLGVDGVITNRPDLLGAELRRSAAETDRERGTCITP